MTETFLFVRLGEGEVCRNVVWKLKKCHDNGEGAPTMGFLPPEGFYNK